MDCACLGPWQHHTLKGVRRNWHDDVTRFLNKSPENQAVGDNLKSRIGATLTPQLLCLVIYRLAHWMHLNGWRRMAALAVGLNAALHRVHLSADSCLGPGCLLPHPVGVFFVGRAGESLTVYSMAVCSPAAETPLAPARDGPTLGARVTLGVHSVLLGRLTVGDDTKIGFCVRVAAGEQADVPSQRMVMPRHWRPRIRSAAEVEATQGVQDRRDAA